MVENGRKWKKTVENGEKRCKTVENGGKRQKMVVNDRKRQKNSIKLYSRIYISESFGKTGSQKNVEI